MASSRSGRPHTSQSVFYIPQQGDISWYFELDNYDGRWLGTGLARDTSSRGEMEHYPLDTRELPSQWVTKMAAYAETMAQKDLATRRPHEQPLYPMKEEQTLVRKFRHLTCVCPICRKKALTTVAEGGMELDSDAGDTTNYLYCKECNAAYPLPDQIKQAREQPQSPIGKQSPVNVFPEAVKQPRIESQHPIVDVMCPRCKGHNSCSAIPSSTRLSCAQCKREFFVRIGRLVGGNRVTVPGTIIWTYNEQFTVRVEGLDGQRYHCTFELPGVGFDYSGGDLIGISFLGDKPRLIQNYTTGRFVTITSGGCLLSLITVLLSALLVLGFSLL